MDPITRAKKRRNFFKLLAPAYDNSAKLVLFGYYYHLRRQVKEKIDITSEMLDRARTKTNAEFILTDVHTLPFRNEMLMLLSQVLLCMRWQTQRKYFLRCSEY